MFKSRLLLVAAIALAVSSTALAQGCVANVLGKPCCPGAKVGDFCGPGCSGLCPGYCKVDPKLAPKNLLRCKACGALNQRCCPGAALFSPCQTGCSGGGCTSSGTCVGTGTGTQLTCTQCGQVIGEKCCPGQKAFSSCRRAETNSNVSTGYCTKISGVCKSCNELGKCCCPGAKPGDPCNFGGTCKGTGTGRDLVCKAPKG